MSNIYGVLISSVTVGAGGASSIDFTSIPGTYTDLVLVVSARSSIAGGDALLVSFNGSTTGFTSRELMGTGSAVNSYTDTQPSMSIKGTSATASTFSNGIMTISNYAGSTNKTLSIDNVNENNAAAATQEIWAGIWANTSAITRVTLTGLSGSVVQYTTAYLYGLLKGSGGATAS